MNINILNWKILPLYLSLFLSSYSFSQNTGKAEVSNVARATFFNPGISYEFKAGRLQSLFANAYMSTSFGLGYSSSLGNTSFLRFDPALAAQYRYYYNLDERAAKGKRTAMNTGNYVCAIAQTVFSKSKILDQDYPETKRRPISFLGLAWGIQRNFKKRFALDLDFGGGYAFGKSHRINDTGQTVSKNVGHLKTTGRLDLGFWLNKRT